MANPTIVSPVKMARYELRTCVCARTRACACEIHSEEYARCVCVLLVFGHAMCDRIFAPFWNKTDRNWHSFCLKNYSRTFYPVLEHPFLLLNILSCFSTFFPALESPILFQNTLKIFKICRIFFEKKC